jgi:nucleotide-binding universal stress UspA family protein
MYAKILVAVDRSAMGRKVFATALVLAQNLKSELNLVHVLSQEVAESPVSFAPYALSFESGSLEEFQREWEKFKQECVDLLQVWVEQAEKEGVKAQFTQLVGNPGAMICQQAQEWGADLIVMGRRGHSTVSEILLGSVSSYVIHRCHCSLHLVQS